MAKAQKTTSVDPVAPVDPSLADGSYICVEPVKHNGKRHEPEAEIVLNEDEAAPLLAIGAIKTTE